MFTGAISQDVRAYLRRLCEAGVFNDRTVVVGCSGVFTFEAVISQYATPARILSNDVSIYSSMLGRLLTHKPVEYRITDPELAELAACARTDAEKVACLMVLLDMLEFHKRNNAHRVRMWDGYKRGFTSLVEQTAARLGELNIQIDDYWPGDVVDHFAKHYEDKDAVFMCYAPTYTGGYERLYRQLEAIADWDKPNYKILDEATRNALFDSLSTRRFLWYDDRKLDRPPTAVFRPGRMKAIYLYSNEPFAAYVEDKRPTPPPFPLMTRDTKLLPDMAVKVERIKTTDSMAFKDVYLSKKIDPGKADYALAVWVGDSVVGFIEYSRDRIRGGIDVLYMMADFPVDGTDYPRLSKLIVMLAICGEKRALLERITEQHKRTVITTAFTDKAVSMKYRGVMTLKKRGVTEDGQSFLNYSARFNDLTWQETYTEWLQKHGSAS